jgi:hypothetical protein
MRFTCKDGHSVVKLKLYADNSFTKNNQKSPVYQQGFKYRMNDEGKGPEDKYRLYPNKAGALQTGTPVPL